MEIKIKDAVSLRYMSIQTILKANEGETLSANYLIANAKDIVKYIKGNANIPEYKDEQSDLVKAISYLDSKQTAAITDSCKCNCNNTINLENTPHFGINVKIKKLDEHAIIPKYAKSGDAGLDFTAISYEYKPDIDCHVYGTGIAVEIPTGFVGLCFPRSSNRKTEAYLTNSVGVIDSGYRGEIMVSFKNRDADTSEQIPDLVKPYEIGDRVMQMIIIPYPAINFVEVDKLSNSERGANGHGSTGN